MKVKILVIGFGVLITMLFLARTMEYGLEWFVKTYFGLPMPSASDQEIAEKVNTLIDSQSLPMIGFVGAIAGYDGVIYLSGTLRTKEDIERIIHLAESVDGVKRVVSQVDAGNYNEMYRVKIESHLRFGYQFYKTHTIRSKQAVLRDLEEYLFYRANLSADIIQKVEELRDLLGRDIEQAWREETAAWYQTYSHRWLTPEGAPSSPLP